MAKVICLGLLVADTVGLPIDALPRRGTLELVDRIELHVGGCAANTAITLAKLGVSVALGGKVGRDGFGDYLVHAVQSAGVETNAIVQTDTTPTAATIVTVHSDGERSFLHVIGANATYAPADVRWDVLTNNTSRENTTEILHVAGLQLMRAMEGEPLASVLREAKRRGLRTTLDTVMNPKAQWWPGLRPALPFLDWVLPSYEEAVRLTGLDDPAQQAQKFREHGAKNVAIKLGADGCLIWPEGGEHSTIAPVPTVAVDTLGAGDAWVGGFLTGLLHGWPLAQTARFANQVGACCVRSVGATTGILSLSETLALLSQE